MAMTFNPSTPHQDLENNAADNSPSVITPLETSALTVLSNRTVTHHPKAGLNRLADATARLFSIVGKLKPLKSYRHLARLQKELIEEINLAQETIKHHGYPAEYVLVCHYVICATLDDIFNHTAWGNQGHWESFSLLAAFNQDTQHQAKFFSILERIVKEPAHYIDLMELMYVALSLGYKGQYRGTEHGQFQLEQTIHHLYKHIRAFRGHFSKALSPSPLHVRPTQRKPASSKTSFLFIFFVSACIVMTIFVGLGYLMEVITNESSKTIAVAENIVSHSGTAS